MPPAPTPRRTPGAAAPALHAIPDRKDLVYDMRARQAALPILLRRPDGTTAHTVLVLDGNDMHRVWIQLDQAIAKRLAAGHTTPRDAD